MKEDDTRELARLRALTTASLTVGGGLVVYGEMEALNRVQNYILLDSTHPVEREDVRRALARALQKAEAEVLRQMKWKTEAQDERDRLADELAAIRELVDKGTDPADRHSFIEDALDKLDALKREIAEAREVVAGMLTGLHRDGYAIPCGAVHTARARDWLTRQETDNDS